LSRAGIGELSEKQDAQVMIRLTRLNNRPLVVNSELIKFIENAPDTVITLVTGEKIVVLETAEQVLSRIVDYRRQLCQPVMVAPAHHPVDRRESPDAPEKQFDEQE
jgi:flagellar protein FlbD